MSSEVVGGHASLHAWSTVWQSSGRNVSIEEGVRLAKQRRGILVELMRTDPEAVWAQACLSECQAMLPSAVRKYMEHLVEGKGYVEHTARVYSGKRGGQLSSALYLTAPSTAMLAQDGVEVHVEYAAITASHPHTSKLRAVWGLALGAEVLLASSPVRRLSVEESRAAFTRSHLHTCPITGGPASADIGGSVGGRVVHVASEDAFLLLDAEERMASPLSTRLFRNSLPRRVLRTLILLVQFSDEASPPTTVNAFAEAMGNVNEFWRRNSYQCSSFDIQYGPVLRMDYSKGFIGGASCPISGTRSNLHTDMWAKANAAGYEQADWDRVMFVFSHFEKCPWAGLGLVAGSQSWINQFKGEDWHVLAHELGHNFGLQHANVWVTSAGNSPNGPGNSDEYGDDYNMMGAQSVSWTRETFHVNVYKKNGLTWIPDDDITTTSQSECTTRPCYFRIFAHDTAGSYGRRAVRTLLDEASGRYYYMEYRTAVEHPEASHLMSNGVTFHFIEAVDSEFELDASSNLLDMTAPFTTGSNKASDTSLDNAALQLGRTFTDLSINFIATPVHRGVLGEGLPYIDLMVYRGTGSTNTAPNPSGIAFSCNAPSPNSLVALSVTAGDVDGDTLHYSWDFGDGSRASVSSPSVVHAWSLVDSYTIKLHVSDGKGGVASVDETITVAHDGACDSCASCANGDCAGGVCHCDNGWTGAACSVELKVTAVSPAFIPIGSSVVVTVSGSGFGTAGQAGPWCRFGGAGIVRAALVSSNTITCSAPLHARKETVVVTVSPDYVDWSSDASVATFTFGGGACSAPCAQGTCDATRGVCVCNAGFTGPTCSSEVTLVSIAPSFGPNVGGTLVTFVVESDLIDTPADCQTVQLRFTLPGGESFTTAALVLSYGTGSITYYCYTPPIDTSTSVTATVAASLNRGVDWSAEAGSFEVGASVPLYDRRSTTATVPPGALKYFHMFHGDSAVDLTLSATGVGAAVPLLYHGVGVAPYPGACTDSDLERLNYNYGCITNDEPSKSYTYSAADARVQPALYIVALENTESSDIAVEVLAATPASAVVEILVDTAFATTGFVQSGYRYYHVEKATKDSALRIVMTLVSNSATMAVGRSPTTTTADAISVGTTVLLDGCVEAGSYYIGVLGANAEFSINISSVPIPVAPQEPFASERDRTSITVRWPAVSRDPSITYELYYRQAVTEPFVGPCVVQTGTKVGTAFYYNKTEETITALTVATNYQINIVVTSSGGLQATYGITEVRTLPSEFPSGLIMQIAVLCIVLAVLVWCCILFDKRFLKNRKKMKRQQAAQKHKDKYGVRSGVKDMIVMGDFKAQEKAELSIHKGEMVKITGLPNAQGWIKAMNDDGRTGLVPRSFLRERKVKPKSMKGVKAIDAVALASFTAKHDHELSFKRGQHLSVLVGRQKGWVRGFDDRGRHGLIPSTYIEITKKKRDQAR